MQTTPKILIAGGSVRAAADSAQRGGWQVIAYDQYGDLDLQESSIWQSLPAETKNWSFDLAHVEHVQGWTYTGPFENWPADASRFSEQADKCSIPLLGVSPRLLKRIRDPRFLQETFASIGGNPLAVILPGPVVPSELRPATQIDLSKVQELIRKPLHSGGGFNVRDVSQADIMEESFPHSLDELEYLQEKVHGVPQSCIFMASSTHVERIGWTEGLMGTPWGKYGYRGSVGPITVPPPIDELACSLANAIVKATGLSGILGIDGIRCDESWRPIEINPRYTASCEILEGTVGHPASLMDLHLRAWQSELMPPCLRDVSATSRKKTTGGDHSQRPDFGCKQIVYAGEAFNAPDLRVPWLKSHSGKFLPQASPHQVIADIPMPGSLISSGYPVCTLFGWGSSIADARRQCAEHWSQLTTHFPELKLA
ncbi:protein of unknown function DUF201 [Planctopirus limnophila DSM 3776]|uniref:ATP-grasp fold PylC-type domain-containing protein n=1 Tax=Planctopirus limnophila (strain ATCC 43296 / DSM 3776 / IFAM 1008 / Mu 290) TaxID=521674 RepID=D5SYR8_PLAL2|nr:ATP-grasp domain-containing protein [Planctopirus limnophila]ADG67850.1 protein of unknown function DUF201 [Planctopirus limnophila DSM 3776]